MYIILKYYTSTSLTEIKISRQEQEEDKLYQNLFQRVGPRIEMQKFHILSCCLGTEKLLLACLE